MLYRLSHQGSPRTCILTYKHHANIHIYQCVFRFRYVGTHTPALYVSAMQTHTCAYCQICLCMETCVCSCACVYTGGPTCMTPQRGLHECVHGCVCTCVQGCACRCEGEHGHFKGVWRQGVQEASSSLGRDASSPSRAGGGGRGCVRGSQATLLEADLGHSSRPPPSTGLAPPCTLASITAEKKVPKSSAGWRQGRHGWRGGGRRRETRGVPCLAHRAPPAANPISPPLGRGRRLSHSHCPL